MNTKKSVLLVSHYTSTPGMAHKFFDFLQDTYHVGLLLHPLIPASPLKSTYKFESISKTAKIPPGIQFGSEMVVNKKFLSGTKETFNLIICFDPLSFMNIYFYKQFINRKAVMVYYNLDYSRERFANNVMNTIYQKVNIFAFKKADYFMSPTSKMIEDLDPEKKLREKCFILPHAVAIKSINKKQQRRKNAIIYAGTLGYTVDFSALLKACRRLEKEKVAYKLDIFGEGENKATLEKEVASLKIKNIHFQQLVENAVLVNQLLPQYQISIAPYITKSKKGVPDHMFHGIDLTSKIVEYIAAGLPVVSTPLFKAFDVMEHKKFGILVQTEDEWYRAIKTLLKDKNVYAEYQKNADKAALAYDVSKTVSPLIKKFLADS